MARQALATTVLLAAVAALWLTVRGTGCESTHAGFWFDESLGQSRRLGITLTTDEFQQVAIVARAELARAFAGLSIDFSDRRDAAYRVAVVEDLYDQRFKWKTSVPAQSRGVLGVGGQGAVSFSWAVSASAAYLSTSAPRAEILEGIGKGIGRLAVHEFTHILLPHAPIHESKDSGSYEYDVASRREQYTGEMHWDLAWPLLQKRLAPCTPARP